MIQELRIKLFSYDRELLDKSLKKIIDIATNTNCKINGPIPLPTKKEVFTVCRSPHVYKPAMEQFERRTHRRLIILSGISPKTIESLKHLIIPAGVEIQIMM